MIDYMVEVFNSFSFCVRKRGRVVLFMVLGIGIDSCGSHFDPTSDIWLLLIMHQTVAFNLSKCWIYFISTV